MKPAKSLLISLILAVIFTAIYLPGLSARDLWAPDEPTYAEVAREMIEEGNWILPHLNGRVYPDKPPVFFWAVSGFSLLAGGTVTPFTARLPSFFSALAVIILCYHLGRRMFGEPAGFLSALVLGTMFKFMWQASWVQIDMMLTAFITASLFSFWNIVNGTGRRGLHLFLFYFFSAAAVLTKGFPGVLPLLIAVVYFTIARDWKEMGRMGWIRGVPLVVLLVSSWLAAADIAGGVRYEALDTIREQIIDRGLIGMHHERPFYYYLYHFPLESLPWFIFLPWAVLRLFKDRERRKDFLFLVVWFAVIFVVFSIFREKRNLYILPLYPPAASAVGYFWKETVKKGIRGSYIPHLAVSALFQASGIILSFTVSPLTGYGSLPMVSILVLGGLINIMFIKMGRTRASFAAVFSTTGILFLTASLIYFPLMNRGKSAAPFCSQIKAVVRSDEPLAIYPDYRPAYTFYTGRFLSTPNNPEELRDYLREGDYFITSTENLKKLKSRPGMDNLAIVGKDDVGHRSMILVKLRAEN